MPVSLSDAGVPNDELAIRATEAGLTAEPVSSVASALMLLRDTWDGPAPRILIGGSLYLAGGGRAPKGTPPTRGRRSGSTPRGSHGKGQAAR